MRHEHVGQQARPDQRPNFDPAGFDAELRAVVQDLQVGRWMSMRALLARTGHGWALRTSRTQVMAAVAARSEVVEAWRAEEPSSTDALLMLARVLVERALHQRHRTARTSGLLEQQAREVCLLAAQRLPEDPVPWVCLLALAQLDPHHLRAEHQHRAPEPMLPSGPWGVLYQLRRRDWLNREAYHRILQFLLARAGGSSGQAIDFARWVASWAPRGSALLVLPLYAYSEHYPQQRHRPLSRQQWSRDPVLPETLRALTGWFDHVPTERRTLTDLSHLAHALWAAHHFPEAAAVFEALGPYWARLPWTHVCPDPGRPELAEREFLVAREQSLAYTAAHGHRPRPAATTPAR